MRWLLRIKSSSLAAKNVGDMRASSLFVRTLMKNEVCLCVLPTEISSLAKPSLRRVMHFKNEQLTFITMTPENIKITEMPIFVIPLFTNIHLYKETVALLVEF